MNRKIIMLGLTSLFVVLSAMESTAQIRNKKSGYPARKPDKKSTFLDTQWWLGLKTGINFSEADPIARFAVFSPVNYEGQRLNKTYEQYKKASMQAGIEVTFYHKGISFSLQPNYRRQRFSYENEYFWSNPEIEDQSLALFYSQTISLDYIEIPFSIKYDILKTTKWRPFIQAGAYYGLLAGAEKSIAISGEDKASGGVNKFEGESLQVGANDLFLKSSAGVLGGVGVNYDLWKIRVAFDIVYRHGLHNISNAKNRYSNNSLSGLGDTMDDITLNNLSFNIGFLFPLRFISKNFNAID